MCNQYTYRVYIGRSRAYTMVSQRLQTLLDSLHGVYSADDDESEEQEEETKEDGPFRNDSGLHHINGLARLLLEMALPTRQNQHTCVSYHQES